MATKNIIAPLSEDILRVIENKQKNKLEIERLCRDHHNPILLHDNESVLQMTKDELIGLFDLKIDHFFIDTEVVFRLGQYCGLNIENTTALILKAKWEKFYFNMLQNGNNTRPILKEVLTDKKLVEKYILHFKPDKGEIINLFVTNKEILKSNFPLNQIKYLIEDLLLKKKFLYKNEMLYQNKELTEQKLLISVSINVQEKYYRLKEICLIKTVEYEELLDTYDEINLNSKNIKDDYFREFGDLEERKKLLYREQEKYRIMIEHIPDNPGLSFESLEKLAEGKLAEIDNQIKEIRESIRRSKNYIDAKDNSVPISNEFDINQYRQEYKELRNELWKLLHPDTCPNYNSFCEEKKKKIGELWNDLLNIHEKNEKSSFSRQMLRYSLPDIFLLKSLYKKTCKILEITPYKLESGNRLNFLINIGTPLYEVIQFLKNEIEALSHYLADMELNRDTHTHEEISQEYQRALDNEDLHKAKMENEIREMKRNVSEMLKKINNILETHHERK